MSWQSCPDPAYGEVHVADSIEPVIVPRARDLGGFEVRRALPSRMRQMVGPFIFFDQMGPAEFGVGQGIDVRPHPHINLATVTYLVDGEIIHRDRLGTMMPIRPGAVNWMTAGRGIVHSERTSPAITVHPIAAQQSGNVVWGHGEFVFDNGPSGNYGITVVNNGGSWHIAMHVSNTSPSTKQ